MDIVIGSTIVLIGAMLYFLSGGIPAFLIGLVLVVVGTKIALDGDEV